MGLGPKSSLCGNVKARTDGWKVGEKSAVGCWALVGRDCLLINLLLKNLQMTCLFIGNDSFIADQLCHVVETVLQNDDIEKQSMGQ